jgi:hypothetical protein
VDERKVVFGIANSLADVGGLSSTRQTHRSYLKSTVGRVIRRSYTPQVHADYLICRGKLLSHINHPGAIPGGQIEDSLRTSPEFMQKIPIQECLERFVLMIYDMGVLSAPPLATL